MEVGTKFSSLDEMEKAIKAYEKQNFIVLYSRDSKLIKSSQTDKVKETSRKKKIRVADETLKYKKVVFNCIKGGKDFKSTSNGARPKQRYIFFQFIISCFQCVL